MLFVIEDNEYAISVPVEVGTAGGNISKLVQGFPNFHFAEIDGTDPLASYAAFKTAVDYMPRRQRSGVRARTRDPSVFAFALRRRKALSSRLRAQSEVERDPITRFQLFLIREGILDEKGIDELEKDVDAEVQEASDRAVEAALPEPGSYIEVRVLARSRSRHRQLSRRRR